MAVVWKGCFIVHLFWNAMIWASTVLECSCWRINRYVAAPSQGGRAGVEETRVFIGDVLANPTARLAGQKAGSLTALHAGRGIWCASMLCVLSRGHQMWRLEMMFTQRNLLNASDFILNRSGALLTKIVWRISPSAVKGTWQWDGCSGVFAEIGSSWVPYTTFRAVPILTSNSRRYSYSKNDSPISPIRGVDFRIRISPRIRSQNRNGLKSSVRDLGQSDLCKNIEKTGSLLSLYRISLSYWRRTVVLQKYN